MGLLTGFSLEPQQRTNRSTEVLRQFFFPTIASIKPPPKKNSIVFYAVFWFEGFVGWLRYGANAMAWNGPLPWVQPSKPVSKPSSSPATQLKDVDQWVGRRPREGSKGGALGIPFDSSKVWETPWKILCISSTYMRVETLRP